MKNQTLSMNLCLPLFVILTDMLQPRLSIVNVNQHPLTGQKKIDLRINHADVNVANQLRHALIEHTPTLAVSYIHIIKNTSNTPDELLQNRLALLPIYTTVVDVFEMQGKCVYCDGKFCEKCGVIFELSVKCSSMMTRDDPSQNQDRFCLVTGSHLKLINYPPPMNVNSEIYKYVNEDNIKPHPDAAILELIQNQELHVIIYVQKGTGAMHVKWSPCTSLSFFPCSEIYVSQQLVDDSHLTSTLTDLCPAGVFHDKTRYTNILTSQSPSHTYASNQTNFSKCAKLTYENRTQAMELMDTNDCSSVSNTSDKNMIDNFTSITLDFSNVVDIEDAFKCTRCMNCQQGSWVDHVRVKDKPLSHKYVMYPNYHLDHLTMIRHAINYVKTHHHVEITLEITE